MHIVDHVGISIGHLCNFWTSPSQMVPIATICRLLITAHDNFNDDLPNLIRVNSFVFSKLHTFAF